MTKKDRQTQIFTGPVTFKSDVDFEGTATGLEIGFDSDVDFQGAVDFEGDVTATGSSFGGGAVTPNTGGAVATTFDRLKATRHVRLTLTAATLSIDEGDDYGSLKLCDLADTNIMLMALEADLELVKGEVSNGLEAATDVTVAAGTAAASNSTLSGAMVDVLTGIALTASDASPAYQIHSHADASLTYPIKLGDSATLALYLNAAASITATDALTITGTVDLYFVDVGNVTS